MKNCAGEREFSTPIGTLCCCPPDYSEYSHPKPARMGAADRAREGY